MLGGGSLVPSPTPSFPSLAVRYCKRRKAGRGTGNEARGEERWERGRREMEGGGRDWEERGWMIT